MLKLSKVFADQCYDNKKDPQEYEAKLVRQENDDGNILLMVSVVESSGSQIQESCSRI